MKHLLVLLALVCTTFTCLAQPEVGKNKHAIYEKVDEMPSCGYNLSNYLSANLHYPEKARDKNIQGRVIIKFVVNEDGSISDCEVVKGLRGGCQEEALRVIANMPPWKPGIKDGIPVKVYFNQPISFKLEK